MSFGLWGTHFVPGQTWWMAGGAKALFGYMARCQALLQRGLPSPTLLPAMEVFKAYHRVDGDTHIIFVCNPTGAEATETVPFELGSLFAEVWNPYTLEMNAADSDSPTTLTIEPYGSRFLICRNKKSDKEQARKYELASELPLSGDWKIEFPEIGEISADSLFSWPSSEVDDIKYFSGTAKYNKTLPSTRAS